MVRSCKHAASGYVLSVLPVALATACAVWPVHGSVWSARHGHLRGGLRAQPAASARFACYLLASTALCGAQGDLWSASGLVGLALTLGTLAGLATLVARALPTRRVLERALVTYGPAEDRPGGPGPLSAATLRRTRSVAAALLVPFVRRRRDVQRIADLAYGGAGRVQRLDLYRQHSGPQGAPVFVYFHGGHFHSGSKNREALPLLYQLAAHGWIVISANYRLAPAASFPDAHVDAKLVLAWVR